MDGTGALSCLHPNAIVAIIGARDHQSLHPPTRRSELSDGALFIVHPRLHDQLLFAYIDLASRYDRSYSYGVPVGHIYKV